MNYILKKPISWLAVAVFAVSVSYSFYFQIKPAVDAKAYDRIAQNIVSGEGYRESLDVPIEKDNSIVRVGPGYEFFLAGVYQVFGRNLPAVWVIHAFLLSLASVFVYLASLKIFSATRVASRSESIAATASNNEPRAISKNRFSSPSECLPLPSAMFSTIENPARVIWLPISNRYSFGNFLTIASKSINNLLASLYTCQSKNLNFLMGSFSYSVMSTVLFSFLRHI